jgi:DNA-binding NtrC family response regulator
MPRRILIVEDDPGVLRSLVRLMTALGFDVSSATTVGEGLAALDGQEILVLDFHLPDAKGTVVLNKIHRENRPIRTAVFTADPDVAQLLAHGPKPDAIFDKSDLQGLLAWIGKP